MARISQRARLRTIVCQLHLEQPKYYQALANLQGYQQVFVVFRLRGTVVGQAWLPVEQGRVAPDQLQAALMTLAWPVWQQFAASVPPQSQPLPAASVAVCTRNRPADLANCLPGLARLADQGYELLVIDNCPNDDQTERLVSNYSKIRYVREPQPGLDVARNRALRIATGDIVAFTDDDAQVDDGWLPALLRNFDDPLVAVVVGITMPLELKTPAQRWFELTNSFSRGFCRKTFDLNNTDPLTAGIVGAGVNMAIRRSALAQIGPFDEALDGGTATRSGGDQEFFYRTMARGYRIVYDPAALVWHRHRREWAALRETCYTYGVGLFAWWTRVLLIEKELSALAVGFSWFRRRHLRNLFRAVRTRGKRIPLDLALAEFRGALAGPAGYLRARKELQKRRQQVENSQNEQMIVANPEAVAPVQPQQHLEV